MDKAKIKVIRKKLMSSEFEFSVEGREGNLRTRITDPDRGTSAIYEMSFFGMGMNVNKFGPTCITLYSYDMLHKRTIGKIKYEDITLIKKIEK
tara:strand:+ start:213 stop:491 length:279 start_codon:yes stop_codon:yes gene_type:complete